MGYGFGVVIGVKIVWLDKVVIDIVGDGSFRMNCGEFVIVVYYNIFVIVVFLNNGVLGMVC